MKAEDLEQRARAAIAASSSEDGEALAEDVMLNLQRFVRVSHAQAVVIAAWIQYVYVWEKFWRTPYIAIVSAEKMSGKTTLLRWFRQMVPNAENTSAISPAALYRVIGKLKPVMLLDEMDTVFGKKAAASERAEALRMILNAGFEKGGSVTLCGGASKTRIEKHEVFCPKVMACIGALPDTVESRSVVIHMKRRKSNEPIESLEEDEPDPQFGSLKERLKRFAMQIQGSVREQKVEIPDAMSDRGRDISRPLLAVAQSAGPAWRKVVGAALAVLLAPEREEMTTPVQLLHSIREVFEAEHAEKLLSVADMAKSLAELETGPWGDWYGKAITSTAVARLLKPFGIEPKHHRVGYKRTYGYHALQFADAWERYLEDEEAPPEEEVESTPGIGRLDFS